MEISKQSMKSSSNYVYFPKIITIQDLELAIGNSCQIRELYLMSIFHLNITLYCYFFSFRLAKWVWFRSLCCIVGHHIQVYVSVIGTGQWATKFIVTLSNGSGITGGERRAECLVWCVVLVRWHSSIEQWASKRDSTCPEPETATQLLIYIRKQRWYPSNACTW